MKRSATVLAVFGLCAAVGCKSASEDSAGPQRPDSCPATRQVEPPLRNVEPAHRTAEYWIERQEAYGPIDATLLSVEDIELIVAYERSM